MKIKKKLFLQMVEALEDASGDLGIMKAIYPDNELDASYIKVRRVLRKAYRVNDKDKETRCLNDAPSTM